MQKTSIRGRPLRLYSELPLDQRNAIALSEGEYGRLKSGVKGLVRDDVDNWSTWSPPYSSAGAGTASQVAAGEGGVAIVSPGPARYFQVRIDFENDDLFSARRVGALSIDVSGPSLAERIVAEISPREADLGRAREFSYTVIPDLRPGIDLGFSALEISTPVRVLSIGEITLYMAGRQHLGGGIRGRRPRRPSDPPRRSQHRRDRGDAVPRRFSHRGIQPPSRMGR